MIKFSTFSNRYQKEPTPLKFELGVFAQGMTTPVDKAAEIKDSLPLWSPTLFNGNRAKHNAELVTCLVFDVDDGESEFSQWENFKTWDVIAHTSFSHTLEKHKYRIILPLEKPLPASDWEKVWRAALDIWDWCNCKGEPDMKALKDPARMYYRYALPKENPEHHKSVFHKGVYPLDLDYSHIELPKPKVFHSKRDRNHFDSLDHAMMDARVRLQMAHSVNASITGNRAHNILCPHCHRVDAYFFIDISNHPSPLKGWKCNHVNSCGGYGNLAELL